MSGLLVELDALASNPDGTNPGTPLLLTDPANGWTCPEFDPGTAEPEYLWASSVDTEGSSRVSGKHSNRTPSMRLEIKKSTNALLRTALDTLGQKVGKVFAEGGTLKLTLPDGTVRIFDLVGGDHGQVFNKRFVSNVFATVTLRLPAKSYLRGTSTQQADRVETTLPCLVASETGILGDADALGYWRIDNDASAGNDWWGLVYGVENDALYMHTTSSGSGALFYEAESRTAMGGSATAVGPSGASGSGSNVMRNTALSTTPQAILSTQASGGGAHLTHVGQFRVWVRVQLPATNTGTVSVRLEYATGDFRVFTPNRLLTIDPSLESRWLRLDLGLVTIPPVALGSVRWEGRIVASSTVAGDDIDVDWIQLQPTSETDGVAMAVLTIAAPTSFSARDEFDQAPGALHGKALPVGGIWASSGASGDWNVANSRAEHTSTTLGARVAAAGTATFTTVVVQADMSDAIQTDDGVVGLFARGTAGFISYVKNSGVDRGALLVEIDGPSNPLLVNVEFVPGVTYTMRIWVAASGDFAVWWGRAGAFLSKIISGWNTKLATGGTLATGTVGIAGGTQAAVAGPRVHDNFAVWVPPVDAAVFAGQSLEIRPGSVLREDSAGANWQEPSDWRGFGLTFSPAGAEGRTTRFYAAPLYHPEEVTGIWVDDRIDDISGRLTYIARYLS